MAEFTGMRSKLYRESAPSDDHLIKPSLERMEKTFGADVIRGIVGDRGFDSAANEQLLAEKGMFNGLFSRDPVKMKVRNMSKLYQRLQTRRAQTEARIAIMTKTSPARRCVAKDLSVGNAK